MSARRAGAVALAVLVGALASRLGSGLRCPAGMVCAARVLGGDEIAAMPEPCVGQIANDARRLRASGFNAMMFPVRTSSDANDDEQVAPSMLARKIARAAALAHAASIAPLVALTGSDGGHCDGEADRWFVRAYREALAEHRRDDATLTSAVYCARAGALEEIDPADQPARLLDFTGTAPPADASAAGVAGFVVWASEEIDRVRNGDFSRGWDGWRTAGRAALAVPEGTRPDVCAPLYARLAPGASIAQPVHAAAGEGAAGGPTLELHVTPATSERRMRVSRGHEARDLTLPAGAVIVSTALPGSVADDEALRLTVPADATAPIELRDVQVREGARAGFAPVRPAALATLLGRGALPHDASTHPLAVGPRRRVALADVLSEARLSTSNELSARVARQVLEEKDTERPAIFEHPGSRWPTTIRWRLPAASCPRRLTAEVALAADCRGVSNGVEFTAEAGERTARVDLGGTDGATPFALAVDDPDAASFPAVDLVLRTAAGAARDARCDWALWIEPTLACAGGEPATPAASDRRLDLTTLGEPVPLVTRWDETNLWKLYAYFGPAQALRVSQAGSPGWLRRLVPWVTHARILGATGGNTCRHIHEDCAAGRETADHPFPGRCWEGQHDRALQNEILHDDGPEEVLDATTWRASIDDLLASGLLPHVNVSAVPCALADGHDYRIYHWNQRPVRRHDEWRAFLHHLATEIAGEPSWRDWRFSITNEPNCLWTDADGVVAHVGFAGTVDEYAAHVVETVQAMREELPGMHVQLGNFTIGGKHGLEDNLPEYLGALGERLGAAGVAPADFSALSFSLYETPQHGLADLGPYKFGRLRRWIDDASPFSGIPKKLDEAEIHPMVAAAFEERTHASLDATHWAAAWHADLVALALHEGVVSVAPWLKRLFADEDLTRPLPKYWTYALASLAAGDILPDSGALRAPGALVPAPADRPRNGLVAVHAAASDPDGLGWIVTRDPRAGTWWLLAWRHGETPVADDDVRSTTPLPFRVRVPRAVASRAAAADVLAIAPTGEGDPWPVAPWASTGVSARRLALVGDEIVLPMTLESVVLVQLDPSS